MRRQALARAQQKGPLWLLRLWLRLGQQLQGLRPPPCRPVAVPRRGVGAPRRLRRALTLAQAVTAAVAAPCRRWRWHDLRTVHATCRAGQR